MVWGKLIEDCSGWILSDTRLRHTIGRNNYEQHFTKAQVKRSRDLETISQQVSSIFSPFLEDKLHTSAAQSSLASKHTFVCGPEEFSKAGITPQQRTNFQACLSREIIDCFKETIPNSLHLQTDNFPRGALLKVLQNSGISSSSALIFPKGTNVKIRTETLPKLDLTFIELSVDLTAPPPLAPGELEQLIFHPTKELNCTRTLFFKTLKEQEEVLHILSKEVSEFLACFLTKKVYNQEVLTQLKSKGTSLQSLDFLPNFNISATNCNRFKARICSQIRCHQDTLYNTSLWGEGHLEDALIRAEICSKGTKSHDSLTSFRPTLLFPHSSSIKVSVNRVEGEMGEVVLDLHFKNYQSEAEKKHQREF